MVSASSHLPANRSAGTCPAAQRRAAAVSEVSVSTRTRPRCSSSGVRCCSNTAEGVRRDSRNSRYASYSSYRLSGSGRHPRCSKTIAASVARSGTRTSSPRFASSISRVNRSATSGSSANHFAANRRSPSSSNGCSSYRRAPARCSGASAEPSTGLLVSTTR